MPKAKEPTTWILWRLCGTHSDYWEPCIGAFSIDRPTSIPPARLLKLFAQNVLPEDWVSKRILVLPLGEYPPCHKREKIELPSWWPQPKRGKK